jgi:class 3 adenylate cyclase
VGGSVEAMRAASRTLIDLDDASKGTVHLRIGINSGPCMASVVGRKNPKCVRQGWWAGARASRV